MCGCWGRLVAVGIRRLDHVQLAMPAGREAEAVAFYEGVLGIPHVPKPEHRAARAQHTSPGGAAIRRARIPFSRDVTRALLLREVPGLDDERVDDIVDTTLLVVSSSALFEFLDVLEIPIERAARLAAETVERAVCDTR